MTGNEFWCILETIPQSIKSYNMGLFTQKTSLEAPQNNIYNSRFEISPLVKEGGGKMLVHFVMDVRVCNALDSCILSFFGLSVFHFWLCVFDVVGLLFVFDFCRRTTQ